MAPKEMGNYDMYTNGMKKPMEDKLFFVDMVKDEVDGLVDYGCADGELLAHIAERRPDWKLYGIDMDGEMIERARKRNLGASYYQRKNLGLLSNNYINMKSKILNLSSVLHELYSYSNKEDIRQFWWDVSMNEAKYIAIRDFMVDNNTLRKADPILISKIKIATSRRKESHWLSDYLIRRIEAGIFPDSQKEWIHYLMKYRYKDNWEREVRKDYFPLTVEKLFEILPTDKYKVVYFKHYILPFTKEKIREDFGIELTDETHVQILLERK